jgi:hypothetical protein
MAHTQQEALDQKNAANAAKTTCTNWFNAVSSFYSAMVTYKNACLSRRNDVASNIGAADLAFIDSCLAVLDDCLGPALTNLNDASTLKGQGNSSLSQAEMSYTMMQWDACYNQATTAIGKYSDSNTKSTSAKTGLENGRENGLQANARINTYNLANPPDPGEPAAPTVPTGP